MESVKGIHTEEVSGLTRSIVGDGVVLQLGGPLVVPYQLMRLLPSVVVVV